MTKFEIRDAKNGFVWREDPERFMFRLLTVRVRRLAPLWTSVRGGHAIPESGSELLALRRKRRREP